MTTDTVDCKSSHLASPALLHKIDELREKNIGQHVSLPQVGFSDLPNCNLLLNDHLFLACRRRRSKLRKVVPPREPDKDSVPSKFGALHPLCHTDYFTP